MVLLKTRAWFLALKEWLKPSITPVPEISNSLFWAPWAPGIAYDAHPYRQAKHFPHKIKFN